MVELGNLFFVSRVKKHLGYLESEYGFKVTRESDSEIRPQTDEVVEYQSDTIIVVIEARRAMPRFGFIASRMVENIT